jgi:hypothetical protein
MKIKTDSNRINLSQNGPNRVGGRHSKLVLTEQGGPRYRTPSDENMENHGLHKPWPLYVLYYPGQLWSISQSFRDEGLAMTSSERVASKEKVVAQRANILRPSSLHAK